MNTDFIISCESTTDIEYSYFERREIPVLFYKYTLDGKEYEDNMGRDADSLKFFYEKISQNILPTTSQINEFSYLEFFEGLLHKNKPVLHIAFGSGMTPSVTNAVNAAKKVNEKVGEERIIVIDSRCSCGGYGLLVVMAYEMLKNGKSLEETKNQILDLSLKVQHQFFSTDMKYFRRSGRVSGATATVASILGICPIMHLNYDGKIIAYDKVRGKKKALKRTLEEMIAHAENGTDYSGLCYINHSNCYGDALTLKKDIEAVFKNLKGKVVIRDIGNIVASHCGPGTIALFYVGDVRSEV
ncbi:MAG: DegV family protein [Clostridia bacterium]|nr:DegV family protein [Clostridia bacterium]